MKLKMLEVTDFRNICAARVLFDESLTVISGNNGQGKTNLLEAIFLLTGSKSFRGAKDIDLVNHKKTKAKVIGQCETGGIDKLITVVSESDAGHRKGRFATVNGVEYGRASALAGIFNAVVFEPDHLGLIKGGPEGRRRFMDAALCQLYPGYLPILRRFTKALAQKNILLRRYREVKNADGQLDAFDEELARSGVEITRRRGEYMAAAATAAADFYAELSKGSETFETSFVQSATYSDFASLLKKRRDTDIRAGFTTCGPHREDFNVNIGGVSARVFGSQGQQRSAVLSLKLAEAELARRITGEYPVLLLDDVLSELDEGRQGYLLSKVNGCQSIVTCCDAFAFNRSAGKVVTVIGGTVST